MSFNKKFLLFLSFISFFCAFIFASDGFHAKLGSGNDTWTFGLSENYDDQLSYSLHSYIAYKGFSFRVDAEGYTNRGYKKTSASDFYSGRYDKLDFLSGYYFKIPSGQKVVLELEPELGFSMFGDLGMEWCQNFIHRISKLNEVHLPQDFGEKLFHLSFNGKMSLGYNVLRFDNSELRSKFVFDTRNVFDFESTNNIKLELSISRDNSDVETAYIFMGYGFAQSFSDSVTEKLYAENIKGLEFGFGLSSGLINIDYSKYIDTGFGYTYINVDFVPLFMDSNYKGEDFWFSLGKSFMINREFTDNQIGIPFNNGFSFVFKNRYVTGFPILNETEKNNIKIRYKRNYSFNSVAIRYEHSIDKKKFFTLYSQLGLGISIWNYASLYNMDEFYVDKTGPKYKENLFFTDLELGCVFIPKGKVVCSNAQYQIELFGGLGWIPEKKAVTEMLIRDNSHSKSYKFSGFAPYGGVNVRIGLDV